MRVFMGIGLSDDCRNAIVEATEPFRRKKMPVSWVSGRNLHLTLKFIGYVPDGKEKEIASNLVDIGKEHFPFDMTIMGAGAFPTLRSPRVLWVGILEPLELVAKLQENIENALSAAGFPREERRFHPHVTVARVRDRLPPGWGEEYARALSKKTYGTVGVKSFTLFESRLSPRGAEYSVLRDFPLSKETGR